MLESGENKKTPLFFEINVSRRKNNLKENWNTVEAMGFSKLKGVIIAIISKRDVSMRLLLVLVVPLSGLPLPRPLL